MTTLNNARESIQDKFIVDWADKTAFTFEEEELNPPNDEAWARLTVKNTESAQETLGPKKRRKYQRSGIIYIQVFTKARNGTLEGDELSTAARDIFEGEEFSGIIANNGLIGEPGGNTKWLMRLVSIDFLYYETK